MKERNAIENENQFKKSDTILSISFIKKSMNDSYYPPYFSLPATMKDFEETENTISLKFEQLTKMLEEMKPHAADFSNITLPRNQIVTQLQNYINESNEKDEILADLQRQITEKNATSAFRQEIAELRSQIDDLEQEIEIEKSKLIEIEERSKPYFEERDRLRSEFDEVDKYAASVKEVDFNEFIKETEEINEQLGVFMKSREEFIEKANKEKFEYEEKLSKALEQKEKLKLKPIPKTTEADITDFKTNLIKEVQSLFTELMMKVDSTITQNLNPNGRFDGATVISSIKDLIVETGKESINEFNQKLKDNKLPLLIKNEQPINEEQNEPLDLPPPPEEPPEDSRTEFQQDEPLDLPPPPEEPPEDSHTEFQQDETDLPPPPPPDDESFHDEDENETHNEETNENETENEEINENETQNEEINENETENEEETNENETHNEETNENEAQNEETNETEHQNEETNEIQNEVDGDDQEEVENNEHEPIEEVKVHQSEIKATSTEDQETQEETLALPEITANKIEQPSKPNGHATLELELDPTTPAPAPQVTISPQQGSSIFDQEDPMVTQTSKKKRKSSGKLAKTSSGNSLFVDSPPAQLKKRKPSSSLFDESTLVSKPKGKKKKSTTTMTIEDDFDDPLGLS